MLFESFLLGNFHLPLNLLLVSASATINQAQVACPHGQFCCLISWEANEEEEMTPCGRCRYACSRGEGVRALFVPAPTSSRARGTDYEFL